MRIIVVAGSKGGPGKTTLSEILSASLAHEGQRIAAIDADPSGALHRWATTTYEGAPFPVAHEVDETELAQLIGRQATQADTVVIDTAGFGNRAATVAMTAADLVLVPLLPGEADLTEAERTIKLIAGLAAAARREIAGRLIFNRMRQTNLAEHAVKQAAHLPQLKLRLSDLTGYGEISWSGRLPTGKAKLEIAALLAELRAGKWLPPVKRTSKKQAA